MLVLFDAICESAGADLYGSAIMGGGLVLAARADVAMDEGVVLVYFDPTRQVFSLAYRHRNVGEEQIEECREDQIWERLRLYLGYKLGIRIPRSEKRGEPGATDNPDDAQRLREDH